MARKASSGTKVDPLLEKYIDKLLKEVTLDKLDEKGKPKYTLTDVIKVLDRKLKLEAIKMKADDGGYGDAFEDDPPGDDPDGT